MLIFKIFNIFPNMLNNSIYMFKKRENVAEIEEGKLLSPKFNNDGLIPVVTTGISPSLSNFGESKLPSSISATFSLFLNIFMDYLTY